jgi:hypothetical protein
MTETNVVENSSTQKGTVKIDVSMIQRGDKR